MTTHAKLSPSAASRWLTCTAAPALEEEFPPQSSAYADEGTAAHELAELCAEHALGVMSGGYYEQKLQFLAEGQYYNQEMQEAAEDYAAFIKEKVLAYKSKCEDLVHELEVRLDLTEYVPEGFGTADCIIVADEVLHVVDFKYGKGVRVEASNNPQMRLYALGALAKYGALYDIKEIRTSIVQPRLGGISTEVISAGKLLIWGTDYVKPRAEAAYKGEGVFNPSEKACKFCKAAAECRARAEMYINLFDDNPLDDLISLDEAGELLARAKGLKEWLKALEDRVFSALMNGEEVADWKLVEGRSVRKYTDEDEVAKALKKKGLKAGEIYTKKVIPITQVEKILGKRKAAEVLDGLIVKPQGSPTLAEINDKRPPLDMTKLVTDAFDEEL